MQTSPTVFLFDSVADGIPNWFGGYFDAAFLRALSAVDLKGETQSLVLRGDALFDELASKITTFRQEARGSSYNQATDYDLYRTIIWDFADAITEQWSTLNLDDLSLILGRGALHCICVPNLPTKFRQAIDKRLRRYKGYLGALEFDLGNPVQCRVFIDLLIKDAVIANGQVIMEASIEGDANSVFAGASKFKPNGERRVAYGRLRQLQPPIPYLLEPSQRGALTRQRLEGKSRFGLQERVTAALARGHMFSQSRKPFAIAAAPLDPSSPLEADLPEAKFLRYLLDEDHAAGGPKAKFFASALGIGPGDWRYLAAQLHDGLKKAALNEVAVKHWDGGFGVSFNTVIPVVGLNGRTIEIDANWIMEPGMPPRLSTAVPARHGITTGQAGEIPPVVDAARPEPERYQAILDLAKTAGDRAANVTVPTPMSVRGFGVEMEGMCGNAWVRIPDARRGFARWAIANGHAVGHYLSGVQIFADVASQSVDRARAYASAFAAVLRHNGIDCEVDSRLD